MPAVRFSRDKRGYEYVYLTHTPTRRGKPGRAQVLYWYRTPPGVRIGRKPFSEDVQRMLEAQNPGVSFDWPAIINTPMPPPDMTEFWREKRRAAKAAREERRLQETEEQAPRQGRTAVEESAGVDVDTEPAELDATDADVDSGTEGSNETDSAAADAGTETGAPRKRRRRRGGRRRKGAAAQSAGEGGQDDDGDGAQAAEAADADATGPESTEPVPSHSDPAEPDS